ncbi:putative methyltransferase DDB_G0268948 [Glandiceps talaboti]
MASSECESSNLFESPQLSKYYSKYRPTYPDELMTKISSFSGMNKKEAGSFVLDVGCGTGQSTRILADYFDIVIGCDISESQITEEQTNDSNNVALLRIAAAEELPAKSNTVDVITMGSALHFLPDHQRFFSEVDRVLKPGGCLAVFGYRPALSCGDKSTELNDIFTYYSYEKFGQYQPYLTLAGNKYRDIVFPYNDIERDDTMCVMSDRTVYDVIEYLRSTSMYRTYLDKNPNEHNILEEVQRKIMSVLDVDTPPEMTFLTTKYPIFLIMCRKPMSD